MRGGRVRGGGDGGDGDGGVRDGGDGVRRFGTMPVLVTHWLQNVVFKPQKMSFYRIHHLHLHLHHLVISHPYSVSKEAWYSPKNPEWTVAADDVLYEHARFRILPLYFHTPPNLAHATSDHSVFGCVLELK